jgi:hypothetical protein
MVGALMREPHPRDLRNGSHSSIVLNGHCEEDGAIVYREACKLGGDKRALDYLPLSKFAAGAAEGADSENQLKQVTEPSTSRSMSTPRLACRRPQ